MLEMTVLLRLLITLGFVVVAYWSLQCINLEKVLLKNRLQEGRILVFLLAIWIGIGVSNAIFSISDYVNTMIQLILNR